MDFPISGVSVSPLVPVLVGFCIAFTTTPAGISGAFLLLPFQVSVLGYTSPGVTATNLLYNVISTPAGIGRFRAQKSLDGRLMRTIAVGAVPAVIVGSILRVTVLSEPGRFKVFAGSVLLTIGAMLLVRTMRAAGVGEPATTFSAIGVTAVAAGAGLIGGVYGISGGSIIAPVLVGLFRLPVKRVAPAALTATLITSAAGVISFEVLATFSSVEASARPDWLLALLFGLGGAAGGYAGARFSSRVPEKGLRILLAILAVTLGAIYVSQ